MLTHHAYLIEDSTSLFDIYAATLRVSEKFEEGNPDFFSQKYDKFGIEESRELYTRASLKTVSGRALFIVGISSITTEAQQALLKLFEEPQKGLVFVVLTPPGLFIPTLKSRFLPFEQGSTLLKSARFDLAQGVSEFLAAPYAKRSAMMADMLDADEEEDVKEKVRDFLARFEVALAPKVGESPAVRASLEDIAKFRSYVNDRSPSLKMILEHFAATLPRFDLNSGSSRSNL